MSANKSFRVDAFYPSKPLLSLQFRSGDSTPRAPSVEAFLAARTDSGERKGAARVVAAIAEAAVPLARRLARGELPGDPQKRVGVNTAGDTQKALDVAAHEHFVRALVSAGVAAILSEEADEVIQGAPDGAVYAFSGDEHGCVVFADSSQSLEVGRALECIVPHCDPTVNLYDHFHCVRGDDLVDVWPVDARGAY